MGLCQSNISSTILQATDGNIVDNTDTINDEHNIVDNTDTNNDENNIIDDNTEEIVVLQATDGNIEQSSFPKLGIRGLL
jgi:hypothetical protein